MNRRRRVVLAAVLAVLTIGGCRAGQPVDDAGPPPAAPPWPSTTTTSTTAPVTGPGTDEPGAVLVATAIDRPGAVAHSIIYRSTDVEGAPIEVTGLVFLPEGDPPAGGFPVLTWAHGTIGVGDDCAPSRFGGANLRLLDQHLDAGYAVVATDYEGLGSPGVHPYLVKGSEARSVLDIVRSARELHGADVVSDRVVIAGHSQGGHAALAAAELAPDLAPDLDVVGVASLAPAADLRVLVPVFFGLGQGGGLGLYVAAGWPDAHPELQAADLFDDAGVELVATAAETCTWGLGALADPEVIAGSLRARPTEFDTWTARIAENDIDPTAIDLPVLLIQGADDVVIPAALTETLFDDLCAAGVTTRALTYADANHRSVREASIEDMHAWFADRLAGAAPPSDC